MHQPAFQPRDAAVIPLDDRSDTVSRERMAQGEQGTRMRGF
jgi:hypothetical protein